MQLRTILEAKGHTFRTHSDTECILHAYEQFGDKFESHLTGMFAFALWDIPDVDLSFLEIDLALSRSITRFIAANSCLRQRSKRF